MSASGSGRVPRSVYGVDLVDDREGFGGVVADDDMIVRLIGSGCDELCRCEVKCRHGQNVRDEAKTLGLGCRQQFIAAQETLQEGRCHLRALRQEALHQFVQCGALFGLHQIIVARHGWPRPTRTASDTRVGPISERPLACRCIPTRLQ